METRKSRFDDHVSTIESSHSKTASANQKAKSGNDLLTKLAEELGLGDAEKKPEAAPAAAAADPTAEGEVSPAASTIVEANPAVLAATDAVAMPQVEMAGGVAAVAEAGSQPNPQQLIMPIISAADGNAQTASDLGRTPEAVAAAAEEVEAEKIGALIAKSFQANIEKAAKDQEYTEALEILKEAGLLEGYNIKDTGMTKTASAEGYLEKIANMQQLNREDIIGAAYELVEFQKQAADAEAEGRAAAQNLVELMQKVAEETPAEEAAEEKKEEEKKEEAGEEKDAHLKMAALLSNPKVVEAIRTLKSNNVI
jgi:hypothetical protein